MRCPDCNKFVSYEMGEPDLQDCHLEDNQVFAEVRLVKQCVECSTELEEVTFSIESDVIDHPHDELELEDDMPEVEITERTEGKGRYMKTFIGASVPFKVICQHEGCDFCFEGDLSDEIQASGFDSLV